MTFIQQQKELARTTAKYSEFDTDVTGEDYGFCMTYKDLNTLVETLLTNVGTEIERRLEEAPDIKENGLISRDTAITITREVTGREAE